MSKRLKGAIKRHCQWCRGVSGRHGREVIDACEHTDCALWQFRPQLRPEPKVEARRQAEASP